MPQLTRLIINGVDADLQDDNGVSLTYAVNDIRTLADRQSTYSNTIKLPKSANNKAIFGYSDTVQFTQIQPYRILEATLEQSGIGLITHGQVILQRVNDFFEIQITHGLIGFLDLLKVTTTDPLSGKISIDDLKLTDLDWSDIPNFNYDVPTMLASQTSGPVLWPVVDYGDTLTSSSTINATYLRPGIFFEQIWARIAKYTGYTFTGGKAWISGMGDFIPFTQIYLLDYQGTKSVESKIKELSVVNNLPDMKVLDFIKDYIQRYFLTPIVDNYSKTIRLFNFDELYANLNIAKEWTGKFVNDSREDAFTIGSYAQNNRLLFKEDSQTDLFTNPLGNFTIDNEILDPQKDILTSIFSGSFNYSGLVGDLTIASIKAYKVSPLPNFSTVEDVEVNQRVLQIVHNDGIYRFQDSNNFYTLNSGIKYGVFNDFQYQIDTYGQGFLKMLAKARTVSRYVVLTVRDIAELDFTIPIYDGNDNAYYYINKISNYISGQKVQVNLIRL